LDYFEFGVPEYSGLSVMANVPANAGNFQDFGYPGFIFPHKYIGTEKGCLHLFLSITPLPQHFLYRQVRFKAEFLQEGVYFLFPTGFSVEN
jgi:hypothetical protein